MVRLPVRLTLPLASRTKYFSAGTVTKISFEPDGQSTALSLLELSKIVSRESVVPDAANVPIPTSYKLPSVQA
jgi:hypothetical protein